MTDFVVPHDTDWATAFARESRAVEQALGPGVMGLHHIGSTSVPGILAKPIIDMLGVVDEISVADRVTRTIEALGYQAMGAFGIEGRRYFRKLDQAGRRTHPLHVFAAGAPDIERHIAFRDYLRGNPHIAKCYSELKARITSDPAVTWEAYMDAKAPFIDATETDAVDWYRRIRASHDKG